jgi:hypothetical protein
LNVYMQVAASPRGLCCDLPTRECSGPASRTRSDLGKSLRGTTPPRWRAPLLTRLCMCTGF